MLPNLKLMLPWFSAAILDIWRHWKSEEKLFLNEICPINTSLKQKKNQKFENSLRYGRKTSFSSILKYAAILKTCEKNFQTFQNFKALILIENVVKNLKNHDGVRFYFSLQKSMEPFYFCKIYIFIVVGRLLVRLSKLICTIF
jgi:hypothetical protein